MYYYEDFENFERSGEWPYPEVFSEDDMIDHAMSMREQIWVIGATYDQLETARSKSATPEALYEGAFEDLEARFASLTRTYHSHVAAAKPWMNAFVLAEFDQMLPKEVSEECYELVYNYNSYRQLFR